MCFISKMKKLFIILSSVFPCYLYASEIIPSDNHLKVNVKRDVTIIDISSPDKNGLSHNQYSKFNVSDAGVVLNNGTEGSQSYLAGEIEGNINLRGSSASLIINEIISDDPSDLSGAMEVSGNPASVIIANPNGITCDGCKFINTPDITLATGNVNFNPENKFSSLNVRNGSVTINKKGMDTYAQKNTNLISADTKINGKINAKDLVVINGENKINYQDGVQESISGFMGNQSSSVNMTEDGGISAEKIRIINTSSDGNVRLSNVESVNNGISVTTKNSVLLSGDIKSKERIRVIAGNITIGDKTKIVSGHDVTLISNDVLNAGEVISKGDVRIFSDVVNNQGNKAVIQAAENLWIQKNPEGDFSRSVINQSASLKSERGNLIIKAKVLTNVSNSEPVEFSKLPAESTEVRSVGNQLRYLPVWRRDGLLIVYPELKDFKYKKWFDEVDLLSNDSVNVEKYAVRYKSDYHPAYIDSGKNIYINANHFDNNDSFLSAGENIVLTGKDISIKNHEPGILKLWERYEPEDINSEWLRFSVEPDTIPPGVMVNDIKIFSWDLKKHTIVRKDVITWKIHIAMSAHW
ncbi:filamentous hemagglutinin N-terminal domain-containing protein [Morganella morganii]|uniref:filamentous hemagglutinin N-terminal domain-containing protein n=1 Tax=Morganella morganii TaxID=582 RepID=UPI001FFC5755|nr:filamentous hemagglutinin N-terminal domain-containing protein [Morganella morganii]